jgi:putative ABC transport system substrate-binding protein
MMTVLLLIGFVFASIHFAEAQQSARVPHIGFLRAAVPPQLHIDAFRQSLQQLGYVEGKNIAIDYRFPEGNRDQVRELASELVRLPVDVIVVDGSAATQIVKDLTSTIPIVMQSGDPVGIGFVVSLARPGGNITGLTSISVEMGGKHLELLKEIIPRLTRVAVILPEGLSTAGVMKEMEAPAKALKIQPMYLTFRGAEDIERAVQSAIKGRAEAIIDRIGPGIPLAQRRRFEELAIKNRLPTMRGSEAVTDVLISYGPDRADMYRRFATFVDKILKGAKPAELPIEQPTKFEFIINLKTAKQIGLTIPPSVLARADRVIK